VHGNSEVRIVSYYQWVGLVLFMQGLFFSMPHYLWKMADNTKVESLIKVAKSGAESDGTANYQSLGKVGRLLARRFGRYKGYGARYVVIEVASVLSVILHIVFIDSFIGGEGAFVNLGFKLLAKDTIETNVKMVGKPVDLLFPRMAKCFLKRYGPSGNFQEIDTLCMIPLNK